MAKVVWHLTKDEKREIENLFEKKIALESLSKILDGNNDKLYNRLLNEYGKVLHQFQDWWSLNSQNHKWEGSIWHIDFNTSELIATDI